MKIFAGDILSAAIEGALVLTVNDRLARSLRSQIDSRMANLGRAAWRTPAILTFDQWMFRNAGRFGLCDRMLNPEQVRFLWERIIEEDIRESGEALMRMEEAARQAAKAHSLLLQYDTAFRKDDGGEDQRTFLRWREKWQTACRSGGWEDPSRTAELVRDKLLCTAVELPQKIILAGFDDMTPAVAGILAELEKRGSCVCKWEPPGRQPDRIGLTACQNAEEEVRRCARWIRGRLAEGEDRIGVVAVELGSYRNLIERIFREELAPSSLLPGEEDDKGFNLSLGSPLGAEGPVVAAFAILCLNSTVALDQIGFLLRSPYVWGHLVEQHRRGMFDSELRRLRMREIPLDSLIELSRDGFKKGAGRCDIFAQFLETVALGLEEKARRSPGNWANCFAGLLEALRWPGDRTLDSREYQVCSSFRDLLETMASLDCIAPPMDRGKALALLRRMAAEKLFQPEGSEGRIQVMGTLEAAGLEFDHLWVLGMHAEAFPPSPHPNPFLPLALQKRCGMPRADAARELRFAEIVAVRLVKSASEVILSYPRQNDDQCLQVSPLFSHLAEISLSLSDSRQPAVLIRNDAPIPETLKDEIGSPLVPGKKVPGGTGILKDQALCPFRAFARYRLHAEGLAEPALGLDGLDRGSLVHNALELFWRRTIDLRSLLELSEQALVGRIEECVGEAIDKLQRERQVPLPSGLKDNEARRLACLLREWLEVEKNRSDFRVECLESWHRVELGQLSIQTRLDRIDRIEDGSRIIIDYKTGWPGIQDWLGERPVEPQLPLYGLDEQEKSLAAVSFARVRGAGCAFIGVAREGGLLPGIPALQEHRVVQSAGVDDWKTLLTGWREKLLRLSDDFAAAKAAVDPIDRERACDRCDLHPLCRVGEGFDEGDG
ncbi:MAG: PD-(D/E)XK nuclease family protein [Syntrophotaleaceae bacterium]